MSADFLDTSALVKRYSSESGTATDATLCDIARAEGLSVLNPEE
jgi:hypothetical protein